MSAIVSKSISSQNLAANTGSKQPTNPGGEGDDVMVNQSFAGRTSTNTNTPGATTTHTPGASKAALPGDGNNNGYTVPMNGTNYTHATMHGYYGTVVSIGSAGPLTSVESIVSMSGDLPNHKESDNDAKLDEICDEVLSDGDRTDGSENDNTLEISHDTEASLMYNGDQRRSALMTPGKDDFDTEIVCDPALSDLLQALRHG